MDLAVKIWLILILINRFQISLESTLIDISNPIKYFYNKNVYKTCFIYISSHALNNIQLLMMAQ